jgi:hypothetical protein
MKNHLQTILLLSFVVILTISGSAYAQDNPSDYLASADEITKIDIDGISYITGEMDDRGITVPKTSTDPKDTLNNTNTQTQNAHVQQAVKLKVEKSTPPPTKPTVEKHSKKEDDSILTFNFLYYIIEKYKLQDIID